MDTQRLGIYAKVSGLYAGTLIPLNYYCDANQKGSGLCINWVGSQQLNLFGYWQKQRKTVLTGSDFLS